VKGSFFQQEAMPRSSSALTGSPRPLAASDSAFRISSILKAHPVRFISPRHLLMYVDASWNLPLAFMHIPRAIDVSMSPT